jgi:DNA-binding response OmpR family regulator
MWMPVARVLVVDDELDIREAVSEVLAFEGHEVVVACEGAEALRKCHSLHPDLVLLDLMMPGMNGWDFRATQLRDPAIADIPVVILSALGRVPNIDAAAFLPKPFGLDELLDLVRRNARRGGEQLPAP